MKRDVLKSLGFPTYRAYLFSRLWQARRSAFAKKHPRKCYVCGSVKVQLHHKTYARVGMELNRDLTWLCKKHHEAVHRSRGSLATAHVALKRRYKAAKKAWKKRRKPKRGR